MNTAPVQARRMRRKPKQQRSQDRVEDILSAAMALVGEKGLAALSCLKLDDAAYRIMTTIRDDAFRLAADTV